MQYLNLGKTGMKVSRLCLGMMSYGSKQWREWLLEEEDARPFVRRALMLGGGLRAAGGTTGFAFESTGACALGRGRGFGAGAGTGAGAAVVVGSGSFGAVAVASA